MATLTPQESDFEMSEAEVAKAKDDAQKLFDELAESESRATMFWLASFFRQWDLMARQ